MLDGRIRSTGFPIRYLNDLMRLSGMPLLPAHTTPQAERIPVPRTPAQRQRDLAERAARVKARNAELLGDDPSS